MLAPDELGCVRFVQIAFRALRRPLHRVRQSGQQKCAVMSGEDLSLDDIREMTIPVRKRFIVLCALDLRPIQRRIPKDDPDGMWTEMLFVDVAYGLVEFPVDG